MCMKADTVTIDEFQENEIDALITFIYTGSKSSEFSTDSATDPRYFPKR